MLPRRHPEVYTCKFGRCPVSCFSGVAEKYERLFPFDPDLHVNSKYARFECPFDARFYMNSMLRRKQRDGLCMFEKSIWPRRVCREYHYDGKGKERQRYS